MKQEERKRPTLKLWVRIILITILSLGMLLPILRIYLNYKNKDSQKESIYSYKINQNADYKVELYDNNFTDEKEMTSKKVYISDLVKNIKLNLNYTYSGTKETNLDYEYNIKGTLYGETTDAKTGETNTVWEKNYNLLETQKRGNTHTPGFVISENLNIDYPKYKEQVANFKKQFGMSLATKLKITLNVSIKGKYQEEPITRDDKIILEIPIGVQAFSIIEDYEKEITKDIYKETNNSEDLSTKIYIIISIVSFIVFLSLWKPIFNIKPKSKYMKELDKILKNYGQVIVEVESSVKEKGYNVIIVKNFNEMLDLEEELRLPIIFYENIYKYHAVFTITKDNTIYKYILKNQ